MKGKTTAVYQNGIVKENEINPFGHKINLTTLNKIQIFFMSLSVAPIRFFLVVALQGFAALICFLAQFGAPAKQSLSGWRSKLRYSLAYIMRIWYIIAGFHNVKIKGKRVTCKEAPILVLSPHSSYFDTVVFTYLGGPSVVVREDLKDLRIVAEILTFAQSVFVNRDDPASKMSAIEELKRRSYSDDDWSQVMVFPEGTCTNRSCLMRFQVGAFLPGVPVQPVCIRYQNEPNTLTWTWDGPGIWTTIWLTFCQFNSNLEIEFLPVYTPCTEEKLNARLFADNVRKVMSDALGVPTTDLTFQDCRLISETKEGKLPFQFGTEKFHTLRSDLSTSISPDEELPLYLSDPSSKTLNLMSIKQFADKLEISEDDPRVKEVFKLFDRHESEAEGFIDFREYIIGLHLIQHRHNIMQRIKIAFKLYDKNNRGYLRQSDFITVMVHCCNMSPKVALSIFNKICDPVTEGVTLEKLKQESKSNSILSEFTTSYQPYMRCTEKLLKANEEQTMKTPKFLPELPLRLQEDKVKLP